MNIYLASALTHVPREQFRTHCDFLHALAHELGRPPTNNQVSYALVNTDPQLAERPFEDRARLCYLWDRELVRAADLVIAEASFPAIGLGIEMQIAESQGTPVVIAFRDYERNRAEPVEYVNPDTSQHQLQIGEGYVSLMALGLPTVYRVIRYSTDEDGLHRIGEAVNSFSRDSS